MRHSCSTDSRRCTLPQRAFSLVEVLIVVVILSILAGIVFPKYRSLSREAYARSLAKNVHSVREMIEVHSNSGEYACTAAGFPTTVHAAWFANAALPDHSWTASPMVIQVVAGGASAVYPSTKTFDPNTIGASNAWYNTDNGAFCALVPPQSSDAETLNLFNIANVANAASLNATN